MVTMGLVAGWAVAGALAEDTASSAGHCPHPMSSHWTSLILPGPAGGGDRCLDKVSSPVWQQVGLALGHCAGPVGIRMGRWT